MKNVLKGLIGTVSILMLACILFFLVGCMDSGTRNGDDKDIKVTIDIENNSTGNVYLNPDLGKLVVTANDTTKQDTENEATLSPDTTAALAKEGATGTAVKEGKALLENITNKRKNDNNSKKDSDNPVDNSDHSDNSDRSDHRQTVKPDVIKDEVEVKPDPEVVKDEVGKVVESGENQG